MLRQELSSGWRMREAESKTWFSATVPGSVFGDLIAAGEMEEPWYRDNEADALARMEKEYRYETEFDAAEGLLSADEVLLRFHGLDTLATIALNGTVLGEADNMHRTWDYPVKRQLKEKDNRLSVLFHSPTKFIREAYAENPIKGSDEAMKGSPHLRKAHCMFGWDWGARIPDAGIWRPVELLGVTTARLDGVLVEQEHKKGVQDPLLAAMARLEGPASRADGEITSVTLTLTPDVYLADGRQIFGTGGRVQEKADLSGFTLEAVLTDPEGELADAWEFALGEPMRLTVDSARLWWPHGYGEQPLYTLKCTLRFHGLGLDAWERRIGLRTMTVLRERDEWGESFTHLVNGRRIFAMGADYIPEDNLLGRVTPERTRRLLADAVLANHNAIRVWGGGYYPDDAFYDICDELGLMVWQDFMFACSVYDLTPAFEESITAEFTDNIRRLRHHASLALWCGNNEVESFIAPNREAWCEKPSRYSDYIKMYEYLLPRLTGKLSPQTFYWPSSPSSGGAFAAPSDPNCGDTHYWDVWHGGKPFTAYRQYFFRYLSEFGFQSFPDMKTIEAFTLPEDRNIFSYVMEKHQRNNAANGIIMRYMEQTYLYPTSFPALVYASQMLQADAIRYGVEHFRRNRGRCMGTIVWQLNDIWPVASWASIDYFGRWKALHYMEKRFFAPVLVSCEEESMISQDPNINAEPYDLKKSIRLNVVNETGEEIKGVVRYAVRDAQGEICAENGEETIVVPAHSAHWLDKVELPALEPFTQYVSYSYEEAGQEISGGTVLFAPPKFFRFADPALTVSVEDEGKTVRVRAAAYARGVEIYGDEDLLLSDNFFDMNAGERVLTVLRGRAVNLRARSVYDIR